MYTYFTTIDIIFINTPQIDLKHNVYEAITTGLQHTYSVSSSTSDASE